MSVAPVDPSTSAPAAFGHRPALDGVRGFAVVMVVLFHGGISWSKGGFLGVSVFLTLSGFLITSLALVEFATTGRLAIGAFWLRRIRRLLPALLVALALAVLAVAIAGTDATRRGLFGDVLAGLTYTANWRWILSGNSYADLFTSPSPLLHLWSLSVEEQFYVVFPLLAAAVLRWGRRALGIVAVATVAVSVVAPNVFGWSQDRAYYGTDVRAGEIAVGVLAAVVLFGRRSAVGDVGRRLLAILSTLSLVVVLSMCAFVPQTWSGWRSGGLVAFAAVSVLVVVAGALDVGPVAALGRTRVLRRLGRVSYGLYLYHWIVFWFLGRTTDLSSTRRFLLGVAISYALAELSLRLVEDPIRTGVVPWRRVDEGGRRVVIGSTVVASAAAVLVVASLVVASRAAPAIDFDAVGDRVVAAPDGAPSIAVFGDSTAKMTSAGLAEALRYGEWSGRFALFEGDARLGCGVLFSERNRAVDGTVYPVGESCRGMVADWRTVVERDRPDLVVFETGRWETWDMQMPGDTTWRGLGDPVFDDWARGQLRSAVDALSASGATVVLLTPPSQARAEGTGASAVDERLRILTRMIDELAADPGDRVVLVDLAGWHVGQGARDVTLRRDGVHVDLRSGRIVAEEFLLPELATLVDGR